MRMDVEGLDEVLRGFDKAKAEVKEAGMAGLKKGAMEIVADAKMNLRKPALPPNMSAGGHGGSHGYLTNDFIEAILLDRLPLVNVAVALNTTMCGVIAHQSALKDGELLKIPQFTL